MATQTKPLPPRRSVHQAPFISFEGGDGAGKTTQVQRLERRLTRANRPVKIVREPGSTELGERVRELVKSQGKNVPAADALLFMAARAQLMHDVIIPALKEGIVVIGDRFSDSTFAYQGFGGKLDRDRLKHANALATNDVVPDLTIFLNVSPEVGLNRRAESDKENGETMRRFEELPPRFHRDVLRGYRTLAKQEPNRWVEIDGTQNPDEIDRQVWRHVSSFF